MARRYTCDFCGELIENDWLMVKVRADGHIGNEDRRSGWDFVLKDVGHYHGDDDRSCWAEMLDRLGLIHDVSSELRAGAERQTGRAAVKQAHRERDEAEGLWKRLPRDRREALLLAALADDGLVIREITARMNGALGYPTDGADGYRVRALYGNEVTSLVKRLWREGQLEREAETFNVNHTRYRYSRRRGLDGTIADLELAFGGDEAEAVPAHGERRRDARLDARRDGAPG